MTNYRAFGAFTMVLALSGCNNPAKVCTLEGYVALRVAVRDAQTMLPIKAPSVNVTLVGVPFAPILISPSADSTGVVVQGGAGAYDITTKKAGYIDGTQRVTVEDGGRCRPPITADVVVLLTRSQ